MTLETFFEKFELFADAPGAVGRMRELVLQLAVQGKLVDQKRSDGNAAELLAAICSERDTRAARLRTPGELASADVTERAYPIPSNWTWTQLGNIALQIQYGYTASADPSATEIRMLRITDIQNNRVDWPSVPGCQIESVEAEKYLLSPNDILIARTGGTIGKSFIVPDAPVKSVFASYLIRVTPPQSMAARYLKTVLESPLYWTQLRQISAGTGQPNVNGQALGRLAIPLPPLAEQKRIVAKVDELMALCDRLEAQQQERETRHAALARASLARFAEVPTPTNLHFLFHKSYAIPPADLRKSILTLAIQGKLVPQDPNDEPAASLISQIAEEKRRLVAAGVIREKDEAAPITDDELPFEVPYGWEWTRLSSITRRIHYGYTASAKSELKDVRLLRITDIQNNFVDWPSVPGCEIAKDDVAQYQLERSDILVARTGGTVGKTYLVQDVPVVAVFASYLIRIQGGSALFDRYLKLFLESPTYWVQLEEGARGAAQPNVNGQTLGRMVVSVPPLAEQRRIVAKVDQLMALVDELEAQLAASRATAAKLLSALVAELTAA
jgi:type I restriction enzyme S subunit